jgi:hypothetical protein
MEQETGLLGQATCGLCRKVFRFDPQTPISVQIDGERQPACASCRSFADAWRAAFAPHEQAEAGTASEAPELPRRRVVSSERE